MSAFISLLPKSSVTKSFPNPIFTILQNPMKLREAEQDLMCIY